MLSDFLTKYPRNIASVDMSNGVFVKQGCQEILHYDDMCFVCQMNTDGVHLFVADDYTAKKLDCAVGAHCGVITHVLRDAWFDKMYFNLVKEGFKNCLFTSQKPNTVAFTKRAGCNILMHFESLCFACIKKDGVISLLAGDKQTAARLGCAELAFCGNITNVTSTKGVQQLRFEFGQQRYDCACLFTYQTSCLPFFMGIFHPGAAML